MSRWASVLVAAAGVVVYLVALPNAWVSDDRQLVLENPLVRDPSRLGSIFVSDYWWFLLPQGLYRPVTVASIALQHALAGDAPWSYRLLNAVLHGATAGLLCTLLARGVGFAVSAAAAAALLFAMHPACSEAVLQVVGRADLLVAIAAVGVLVLHLADYRLGRLGPSLLVPAALVLLVLGLGAKESAIAIPAVLAAADLARGALRRHWRVHAAAVAVTLVFWLAVRGPIVGFGTQPPAPIANPLSTLALPARLPGAMGVVGRYVGLLLVPLRLSADYSYDAVPASPPWSDPWVALGLAAAVASIVAFTVAWRRGHVAAAVGLALVWLPLLPVANLVVPIGTIMAERFLYLPVAGIATLAAAALARAPRAWPLVVAVAVLFGIRTLARERDWRDETTIGAATAAGSRSCKAHYDHGLALAGAGRGADAETEFRTAIGIRPDYRPALLDLARLAQSQGRGAEAEALFRRAADTGGEPDALVQLAQVIEAMGRPDDARALFAEASGRTAVSPRGWYARGIALLRLGDVPGARAAFTHALELRPGDPFARYGLARVVLYADHDPTGALPLFTALAKDAPTLAAVWYDLGETYAQLGRHHEAVDAFTRATTLAPTDPQAPKRLAEERHFIE